MTRRINGRKLENGDKPGYLARKRRAADLGTDREDDEQLGRFSSLVGRGSLYFTVKCRSSFESVDRSVELKRQRELHAAIGGDGRGRGGRNTSESVKEVKHPRGLAFLLATN